MTELRVISFIPEDIRKYINIVQLNLKNITWVKKDFNSGNIVLVPGIDSFVSSLILMQFIFTKQPHSRTMKNKCN